MGLGNAGWVPRRSRRPKNSRNRKRGWAGSPQSLGIVRDDSEAPQRVQNFAASLSYVAPQFSQVAIVGRAWVFFPRGVGAYDSPPLVSVNPNRAIRGAADLVGVAYQPHVTKTRYCRVGDTRRGMASTFVDCFRLTQGRGQRICSSRARRFNVAPVHNVVVRTANQRPLTSQSLSDVGFGNSFDVFPWRSLGRRRKCVGSKAAVLCPPAKCASLLEITMRQPSTTYSPTASNMAPAKMMRKCE